MVIEPLQLQWRFLPCGSSGLAPRGGPASGQVSDHLRVDARDAACFRLLLRCFPLPPAVSGPDSRGPVRAGVTFSCHCPSLGEDVCSRPAVHASVPLCLQDGPRENDTLHSEWRAWGQKLGSSQPQSTGQTRDRVRGPHSLEGAAAPSCGSNSTRQMPRAPLKDILGGFAPILGELLPRAQDLFTGSLCTVRGHHPGSCSLCSGGREFCSWSLAPAWDPEPGLQAGP